MASSSYQIAERDELDAFGREDDTSAGLRPDEDVDMGMADAQSSSSKRRVCVCVVFAVLSLTGIAIFLAVFLTKENRALESEGPGGGNVDGKPSPVAAGTPKATTTPASIATIGPQEEPHVGTSPPPAAPPTPAAVPTFTVSVVSKTSHDETAFVQGFEYNAADEKFYESTGMYGRSSLRRVTPGTGEVEQRYDFADPNLFGEGMTLHKKEHIFMLTWKAGRGFIFNQSSFELIKEWSYPGEGWGLTMDRAIDEVWMSDGTTELRVLDPETMDEKRRITVTLHGKNVSNLNELEWVCGEVWANVWQSRHIYRIDPGSGVVRSVINADALPQKEDMSPTMDVLNGIAVDQAGGRLWLTGKLWKMVYQVTVSDDSLDLKSCK